MPAMDSVISQLTEYVNTLRFADLPADVVDAAVERLVDTIGCAVGGHDCDAVLMGRRIAPPVQSIEDIPAARAIGDRDLDHLADGRRVPELRDDPVPGLQRHISGWTPSDALGPVLALADAIGSSGKDLIVALVAGYDIFVRQAETAKLRERGWDQGFGVALATAAGASILLHLDAEKTWHAMSIAAVANVPLRATRAGELSLWKGAATSYAAQGALFTTLLAAEGMTGPAAPIDGRHGLKELVTGEFELQPFTGDTESFLTRMARIKFWPVEYHLQAAVWCGIELGRKLTDEEIESVEIETYWSAWHETGSEPAKWDPRTRETADHSMPYVFLRSLQAGALELSAFSPDQFLNPSARALMNRISVRVNDEFEAAFPEVITMRATATTFDGRTLTVEVVNPKGHEHNPVSAAETAEKSPGWRCPSTARNAPNGTGGMAVDRNSEFRQRRLRHPDPRRGRSPMTFTVGTGEAIAELMVKGGVRRMYTVPGESFLEILDGVDQHPDLQLISTRHEGGAAFMAEADAKVSGRPAVVGATRGVGAADLAIGIHTAYQDSTPMIVCLGQVETPYLGREAFQEVDLPAFLTPISKHAITVQRTDRIPELFSEAVRIATSGRPGPVVLAFPADVLGGQVERKALDLGLRRIAPPVPAPVADYRTIDSVARRLEDATRPVIIAGAAARGARDELKAVAERFSVGVYLGLSPPGRVRQRPSALSGAHRAGRSPTHPGRPARRRRRSGSRFPAQRDHNGALHFTGSDQRGHPHRHRSGSDRRRCPRRDRCRFGRTGCPATARRRRTRRTVRRTGTGPARVRPTCRPIG